MPSRSTSRNARREYRWAKLTDERLLELRFCDLGLTVESNHLKPHIRRLYDELDAKGLGRFHPHCWLSTEWFSPDGIPGIAIPFYLAHPRLKRLEKKQVLQVEGGTTASLMRILRHEAGHAIDTAYRLHFRKDWRDTFGSFTEPYPETYKPKAGSRNYVTHLPWWYAQAHPAEDFAETFAVWLAPGSRWRQRYKGWPALRKLEAVDAMMRDIADTPPKVRRRARPEQIDKVRTTLGEHYLEKRMRYADSFPDFFDADLRKIFSNDARYASRPTAASFLREHRPELRDAVARWTGAHAYTIDQVLRDMIDRSKELRLRLALPKHQARQDAMLMLTVQTMNYLQGGHQPVAM